MNYTCGQHSLIPFWYDRAVFDQKCKVKMNQLKYYDSNSGKYQRKIFSDAGFIKSKNISEVSFYMAAKINYLDKKFVNYTKKICFLPGYNKIASKSQLATLLANTSHEHIMPKQFVIPRQINEFTEWSKTSKSRFIVKPANGLQGRGLELYTTSEEVIEYSNQLQQKNEKQNKSEESVVQEYLDSDLINNRKYDIRVYVLETGIDPVSFYVFKDGIIRLSNFEYDEDKITDQNIPILERKRIFATNTALNKKLITDYNQIIWSIKQYLEYEKQQDEKFNEESFWKQVYQIVQETFSYNVIKKQLSFLSSKTLRERFYQFPQLGLRLYGFDFLVQKDKSLKLLEINCFPSIGANCSNQVNVMKKLYTSIYNMAGIRDYNSTPLCNNEKCKKAFLDKIIPDNLKEDEKLALLQIAEERQYMGNFIPVKPESQIFSLGKYNYLLEKYYDKIDDITKDLINYSQRDLIN